MFLACSKSCLSVVPFFWHRQDPKLNMKTLNLRFVVIDPELMASILIFN